MRIILLAHNLRVAGGLSVGRNIVATMPEIAPVHEYLMIVPAGLDYDTGKKLSNVRFLEVPAMSLAKRIWFDLVKLPKIVKDFQPDWVWGLGNGGLRNPPCKQAILFHDSHLIYPEKHFSFESRSYKFKKRLVKHRLDRKSVV